MVEWRSPKPLIRVQFLYPLPILLKNADNSVGVLFIFRNTEIRQEFFQNCNYVHLQQCGVLRKYF